MLIKLKFGTLEHATCLLLHVKLGSNWEMGGGYSTSPKFIVDVVQKYYLVGWKMKSNAYEIFSV